MVQEDTFQGREARFHKLIVGTGTTPITTQTTVSDPAVTATTVGDQGATQNTGWGADTEAHFDEIRTTLNALIVDVAANNAAIDTIIDRLQAFGLIA